MKTAYIIHRWEGTPQKDWYPWLKNQLTTRGYQVIVPQLPDTDTPRIDAWVSHLQQLSPNPNPNTTFIGHSIGCQTILRYLEALPKDAKVGPVFLVAAWLNLNNLEDKASEAIAKPWLTTPINWAWVKSHSDHFTVFLSDTDLWVPQSDAKLFQDKLGATVIIKKNHGHFNQTQLPFLLEAF